MLRSIILAYLALAVLGAPTALATVIINEWSGINPTKWRQVPGTNGIEILALDAGTFSFEAYDSGSGNPAADIDFIVVPATLSGAVTVKVGPATGSGRTYGAAKVKGIDLHLATSGGNLVGITISGNLGETSGVNVKDVSGAVSAQAGTNISITGSLGAALTLTSANSISVAGTGTHSGDISLTGGGTHTGTITIGGDYSGDMTITGNQSGNIRINGDVTSAGSVLVTGAMTGRFIIGDVTATAARSKFTGTVNRKNLAGTVEFGSASTFNQSIDITGALTGTLKLNGNVVNSGNYIWVRELTGGTIWVTGNMELLRNDTGDIGSSDQGWLEIGDFEHATTSGGDRTDREGKNHTGTVRIDGTLSGRVYVLGSSKIHFDIGTVNATYHEDEVWVYTDVADWGYGGITFADEFRNPVSGNAIDIDNFTAGQIRFAPVTWSIAAVSANDFDFEGSINVSNSMGAAAEIHALTYVDEPPAAVRDADITSVITVGGSMNGVIRTTRNITGAITIGAALGGDVITDDGDITGAIDVTGNLSGDVDAGDDLRAPVTVGAALSGSVSAGDELDGEITVSGNLTGVVDAVGDIVQLISIGGDMEGLINTDHDLLEQIQINGKLVGALSSNVERIHIDNDLRWPAAITINWDVVENEVEDDWEDFAIIYIGGDIEHQDLDTHGALGDDYDNTPGNYPWDRVYWITNCRGDVNNDGALNNFDIDPFVAFLLNPVPTPGLENITTFHGDVNCDDAFNNFDIDPFVDAIINATGCVICSGSRGGDGGGADGGAHGELIRTSLASEATLEGFIDYIATIAGEETENEYWSDLLTGLVGEE